MNLDSARFPVRKLRETKLREMELKIQVNRKI